MSRKAVVLGAAGGIGQPLSLLLKQSTTLTELSLFDVVPIVRGVAADLSHINTSSVIAAFTKDDDGLAKALKNADIVVIPAGVPRKPGMTRDDLFKINAGICADLAKSIAENAPKAFVLVISNPVNSTVPVFAEVFKKAGTFDPKRLFGVTTLDIVRASTFVTSALGKPHDAPKYSVPVVGGHSGTTIVPLLSQTQPKLEGDASKIGDTAREDVVNRIQFGGDEVVKAKEGAGSATLSMAYAGYRFADSLMRAKFLGETGIIEDSYIHLSAHANAAKALAGLTSSADGIEFFSLPVELGPEGVKDVHSLGEINDYERKLVDAAVAELKGNIEKGVSFAQSS